MPHINDDEELIPAPMGRLLSILHLNAFNFKFSLDLTNNSSCFKQSSLSTTFFSYDWCVKLFILSF